MHTLARTSAPRLIGTCCLLLPLTALAAPHYTPVDISQWHERTFADPVSYRLDDNHGAATLRADCRAGQASALYLQQSIDLRETPILRWSWRISHTFQGADENRRDGDDYPARLYVVKDGGLLPWRTLALNYVWSSSQPVGSHWPNAYTANAQMLAVSSGEPGDDQLVYVERNVREDFQRLHGQAPERIDGLAIMTDCDNTGQSVSGWYGSIEWLPVTSASTPR